MLNVRFGSVPIGRDKVYILNGEGTSKGHQRDTEGTPEGPEKGGKSRFLERENERGLMEERFATGKLSEVGYRRCTVVHAYNFSPTITGRIGRFKCIDEYLLCSRFTVRSLFKHL